MDCLFTQSACDALNGASTPDSDAVHIQTAGHVLKCLHSILKAAALPPTLHKFETVVSENTALSVMPQVDIYSTLG